MDNQKQDKLEELKLQTLCMQPQLLGLPPMPSSDKKLKNDALMEDALVTYRLIRDSYINGNPINGCFSIETGEPVEVPLKHEEFQPPFQATDKQMKGFTLNKEYPIYEEIISGAPMPKYRDGVLSGNPGIFSGIMFRTINDDGEVVLKSSVYFNAVPVYDYKDELTAAIECFGQLCRNTRFCGAKKEDLQDLYENLCKIRKEAHLLQCKIKEKLKKE